jgi:hypothetical protein
MAYFAEIRRDPRLIPLDAPACRVIVTFLLKEGSCHAV